MNTDHIVDRVNDLERRIKALESSVDGSETVSAAELMRLKDELHSLKLQVQWLVTTSSQSRFAAQNQSQAQAQTPTYTKVEVQPPEQTPAQAPTQPHSDDFAWHDDTPARHSESDAMGLENIFGSLSGKISEIGSGKVILSLVAALLIILAAGLFVRTFWGQVSELARALLLIGSGALAGFAGVYLYNKKGLYPFIILYAIGSAVSYIGIVAANIVYGAFDLYMSIALIILWTVLNLVCYLRYNRVTMLAVTSLGIVVSSALISSMAYDTAKDTEVYPVVYTVISVLMALMPMIAQLIPRLRKRLSGLYPPIVFGTALTSVAINLGYAMSAADIWRWISQESRSVTVIADGSVFACVMCLAILVVLASVVYKINHGIESTGIRGLLTVIEIQGVLAFALSFANHNVLDTVGFDWVRPSVYLASVACILIGGLIYGGAYRFVAFNLSAALAWLVGEMTPADADGKLAVALYVLVALAVYAAYVFAIPKIMRKPCRSEKILSLMPLIVTMLIGACYSVVGNLTEINGYWAFMMVVIVSAFVLMGYDIHKALAQNSEDEFYFLLRPTVDILAVITVCAVFPEYVGHVLAALYLVLARVYKYGGSGTGYKVCYGGLATVFSIYLAAALTSGVSGKLDTILITAADFLMMGIFMSITLDKQSTAVARVLSILISLGMLFVYTDNVARSFELAILSVIIASSVLLTVGFVKDYRSARITSLATLLAGVFVLIVSLSDFDDSMSTVTALLVSGVIVLITSIVYSVLEKRLIKKESDGTKDEG